MSATVLLATLIVAVGPCFDADLAAQQDADSQDARTGRFVGATTPESPSPAVPEVKSAPPLRLPSMVDLSGLSHRLGQDRETKALVLVFIHTECPIARQYIPELNRLADAHEDVQVEFYGVISDPLVTRREAADFQKEFRIDFPVLFDASGELADLLRPTHVPEAFVIGPTQRIVYRGRIDDQYAEIDKKRDQPRRRDLLEAISATVKSEPVETPRTEAVGCLFETSTDSDDDVQVTFARDIAPLMFSHCSECHRPGEVAPFALLNYRDAAKRAGFLARVTRSGVMPPWKAEAGHGDFLGERRLTEAQIQQFSDWAEAGAPEGNPDDLPPTPEFTDGWRLGEPDLVLTAEDFVTVPGDGPDIFHHWVIPFELPDDQHLVAFDFRPGNPAVVHHAVLLMDTRGVARAKDAESPEPGYQTFGSVGVPASGILGVWTPGVTPRYLPQEMGVPMPSRGDLLMQLHLHPTGREEKDRSSVGLYFAKKPVSRVVSRTPLVTGTIVLDVPAGADSHEVRTSVTLPTDVSIISVLPHMHLVGKSMKVTARLPSGEEQPLIWIKDWNFYWQDNYVYKSPVHLPSGTVLEMVSSYDNSAENPLNPSSPPKRVLFGNGSNDEMCFALFQVVADNPGGERKIQQALMQQFMKQWTSADIAPDAREYIIEEAMKLFGSGGERGLDFLLRGGNRRGGS
jgi:thiol-disulfide isomerase/thioredoxin